MDLSDLEILKSAEQLSDSLWHSISQWSSLTKETVGVQLIRSTDSIGANIVEAFGRFHFGDKVKFFYYSRGSIFETKFWLNRALSRNLLPQKEVDEYLSQLTILAKRLNALVKSTKEQSKKSPRKSIGENSLPYFINTEDDLFTESDLEILSRMEN